jgi:uncharacterized protein with GYD domain
MESFYFAFGGDDVDVIVDAPSREAMAAVAATVTTAGVVSNYKTVVLLTAGQLGAAASMSVDYTPPRS